MNILVTIPFFLFKKFILGNKLFIGNNDQNTSLSLVIHD